MSRLESELRRLYAAGPPAAARTDAAAFQPIDPAGRVRAMVLELARPADWPALARVWRGVQADFELPAPAIAVTGSDGFALWFSLADATDGAEAHGVLAALCTRYLPDIAADRLRLWPAADAPASLRTVPASQPRTGYWSAFVAADLAPIFADTPWLDSAPSEDGQAAILHALTSIAPSAWAAAKARLDPAPRATAHAAVAASKMVEPAVTHAPASRDPRAFLQQIMNDDSVALALRIEAAKALLPYSIEQRTQ